MENYTMLQYFEWYYPKDGSLWNKFRKDAEKLKDAGIDTVWLPPAHKGMEGPESRGYDSYDLYDLGEFDQQGTVRTKYGTKAEYIAAVKAAKESGVQVYADVVLNHLGGADEHEPVIVRKVAINSFPSPTRSMPIPSSLIREEKVNTLIFNGTTSVLQV
jgi:alpha-amylase